VQRSKADADTYDDPQADADGYKKANAARGANCAGITPQNAPGSTFGDWSQTDSTVSGKTYAICTLTYDMAFDDNAVAYCNSADEQAKARTIKDYLDKAVLSTAGQASLIKSDYDALPSLVLGTAKAGVASISWNKGGAGRPCSDQPQPQPTATPVPTAGPGATVVPPPPAAVSNKFTISSARVSGTSIRVSLQLPGAGKVVVASSTKPKKGKAITLAAKTVTAARSGTQTVTVALSAKAKKALKKDKKLKVTLKVTFTPAGGSANTVSKAVTVKQPKKGK
jgi:hypothetical protein